MKAFEHPQKSCFRQSRRFRLPGGLKLPQTPFCGRLRDLAMDHSLDHNEKKHNAPNACYDSRPSDG